MAMDLPDYTALVEAAVASYWDVRAAQAARSQAAGVLNPGARSQVTGGRHLDDLHALIVRVFVDAGIPPELMQVRRRPIAGYFRRAKNWDVVVMVEDRVVAIIELKSMGPDQPGKNFNNRTDEALGQAVDIWTAARREIIGPNRPWLGYFMLLEDVDAFTRVVGGQATVFEPDPAFDQTSYADRYALFFERMVREGLLDAACVALGDRATGAIRFPSPSVSFQALASGIHGRCLQFRVTNTDIAWP